MKSTAKVLPLGESALLVQFGKEIGPHVQRKVDAFMTLLETEPFLGMLECVPSYTSVAVYYDILKIAPMIDHGTTAFQVVRKLVSEKLEQMNEGTVKERNVIEIPVCYGGSYGPDLEEVAQHNQLSLEEVVNIHASKEYLVYMIGFAPGFPYLGGMPKRIAAPRRKEPRTLIPAGSVGIAGEQTGVYSIDTPGGWQIIGKTPLSLFRPTAKHPSLLQAGDFVRFQPITEKEFIRLEGEEA
ncbi:5-oxoprolinase subunit PxpB [Halalkalibacterium halodurans]|uniref:5-oxoprolinase subunit PxpB n=1 Tax=Halalkalibacterium halodurans TaxID=86665 RepID=UPI0005A2B3E3|nr:5-oxoprolinase subunit PxpB [Halalkalibacterium halodurans]MED4171830.1 5-oxoprolinase subunit PxpB [Halalkalibacterium halodurans]